MGNTIFSVFVDYVMPPRQDLCEQFNKIGIQIDSNFILSEYAPINVCETLCRSPRIVEFRLFCGKKEGTTIKEVLVEMKENKARPAIVEEYICFLKRNPDLQRRCHQIVAAGSVRVDETMKGRLIVPCCGYHLLYDAIENGDGAWNENYAFLAVQE